MFNKRVLPILITLKPDHPDKGVVHYFRSRMPEYQIKQLELWRWRSFIEEDGGKLLKPLVMNFGNSFSERDREKLFAELESQNAEGIVMPFINSLWCLGLDDRFVADLRNQGYEVWTTESVVPIHEECLEPTTLAYNETSPTSPRQ